MSGFTVAEERAQLRMLTEYALDAVVIMDDRGHIIEWNPSAEEMFGWARHEAVGRTVSELIVIPRFRESHDRWFERFSIGADVDARSRLLGLRRDGSEVPVEVTMWAISPSGSGRRLCSAFIRDISSDMLAAEMQARLAAIVDSSDDAIVGLGLDATIQSWNRGAERLYGYPAEEVLGRDMSFMIPPEREGDAAMIIDGLATGEMVSHFDTVRISKAGEPIEVSMSVSPIYGPDGKPIGAASISRDVTHRRRLERETKRLNAELEVRVEQRTAELEEANRSLESLVASKTDFVASVSHELRTPLTSVIGFAELLMDSTSDFDTEQRRGILGAIADQGYELANIVEDLLVAARTEMGDLNVSTVSVNLKAQTAQVLESMRDEAARTVETNGPPHFVLADPQRVRQVLRNLLTNAMRYGGPHIGVSIEDPADGMVAVRVSDDGDGVSDDALEEIFEPYARGHGAKTITDSFGLGLAISRDLARLMGGDLEYRRTDRTEFVFSLPVDRDRYRA